MTKAKPINGAIKIYRCKHCHVQVISAKDHRAVLGQVHTGKCPRKRL